MTIGTRYFKYAFAQEGDSTEIPMGVDTTGAVSYAQGYTLYYSLPFDSPDALPVGRFSNNGILLDITTAIKQLQENGVPNFISTADNLGTAFDYEVNSVVRFEGANYVSLVDANTTIPPDPSWLKLTYVVPTSSINLVQNSNFWAWQNGTTFITIGPGTDIECAKSWWIQGVDIGAGDLTVTQIQLQTYSNGGQPLISTAGTSSSFGAGVGIAAGTVGTGNALAIRIPRADTYNGKVITVNLYLYTAANVAMPIIVTCVQNFGLGGTPSSTVFTQIGTTQNLATITGYQLISVTGIVPNTVGKTFGLSNTDHVDIQFKIVNGVNPVSNLVFLAAWIDEGFNTSQYAGASLGFETANTDSYLSTLPTPRGGANLIGYNLRAVPTDVGVVLDALESSVTSDNVLINSNFWVWQSSTSITCVPNATVTTADSWAYFMIGGLTATTITQGLMNTVPAAYNNSNYFKTITNGGDGTLSGFIHKIYKVQTLTNKVVTYQFCVNLTSATPLTGCYLSVQNYYGTGGSPSVTTETVVSELFDIPSNLLKTFSITFTMPDISAQTIGTDLNDLVNLKIYLPGNVAYVLQVFYDYLSPGQIQGQYVGKSFGEETANCYVFRERSYLNGEASGSPTYAGQIKFYPGDLTTTAGSVRVGQYLQTPNNIINGLNTRFTVQKAINPITTWYSPSTGAANSFDADASVLSVISNIEGSPVKTGAPQTPSSLTVISNFNAHFDSDTGIM